MPDNIDGTPIHVGVDLEGAGRWLNAEADKCRDDLVKLKNQLAPLEESWRQSQAAGYYQGLQQEWNIAAEGLFGPDGVLGQIAQAMDVNWANYSDAEWSNIRTWQH